MSKDIYNLAYELKELLSNDERIVLLNSLDEKMNNNNEVIALAYQKDMACLKYSDALNHYAEQSKEVKAAQKELYEKKLALQRSGNSPKADAPPGRRRNRPLPSP